jgi:ribosomal protein L25 (general stress protein Ctc)
MITKIKKMKGIERPLTDNYFDRKFRWKGRNPNQLYSNDKSKKQLIELSSNEIRKCLEKIFIDDIIGIIIIFLVYKCGQCNKEYKIEDRETNICEICEKINLCLFFRCNL